MTIHVLQHAAFEGPGEMAAWAQKRGHVLATTHLHRGDALPQPGDFDALVIMGGEMNIYQDRDWPWLKAEREFIGAALHAGKPALGICLGAQFLANALGSRVVQNPQHELGWLPVGWTREARATFPALPAESTVLHWHGDTFDLPGGAMRLASSKACPEQGFLVPGRCLALQFHLEVDVALVKEYVAGQGAWPRGPFVQDGPTINGEASKHCAANRQLLFAMLDRFLA